MSDILTTKVDISVSVVDPANGDEVDWAEATVWGCTGHKVSIYIGGKELGPYTINEVGMK